MRAQEKRESRRKVSTLALIVACATLMAGAATSRADTIYESEGMYIEQFTAAGAGSQFVGGLFLPYGLAFDQAGNLYVANTSSNNIIKFTPGGASSIFASNAGLSDTQGLAFDSAGNLYAANQGNKTIMKFTPAGVGSVFALADHGYAYPRGLAFDAGGNLFVSEVLVTNQVTGNNYLIEKITPDGTGSLFADFIVDPNGLAFDGAGNLFMASYSANWIMKFTPGGVRSTFSTTSLLDNPWGLAFDSAGNLYAANFGGGIVKFTPDGTGTMFAPFPTAHSPTYIAAYPGLPVFVSLSAQSSGTDVILSWPTNAVGFTLQSTSDPTPPATWTDYTNTTPGIVGASFAVTNPISGNQFYRLKR